MNGRAYGLYSEADGATLVNNRTIQALGDFYWDIGAGAMRFLGSDGLVINTGNIEAEGEHVSGIASGHFYPEVGRSGNNTTIKNLGEIYQWSRGNTSAAGIIARGHGVEIYNEKGAIIHSYDTGHKHKHGIYLKSPYDAYISNAGKIITEGESGYGIFLENGVAANQYIDETSRVTAAATIVNSGSIVTSGRTADGIYAASALATQRVLFINTGEIRAQHESANAVYVQKGTNVLVNSGRLDGGNSSIKIQQYGDQKSNGNSYVHLLEGSVLLGDVRLGRAIALTGLFGRSTFGSGLNGIVRYYVRENQPYWRFPDQILAVQDAYFVNDDTVYAVDLTTEQTARQAMLSSLGRSISSGVAQAHCGGDGESGGYWTRPFGSAISSAGDNGISDVFTDDLTQYDPHNTHAAFEGGQTGSLFGGCTPWGQRIYVGFSYGWAETSNGDHFDSETYGGFAGLRGELEAISYGFTAGYLHHQTDHQLADNRREITETGRVDRSDDYGTWFVMPSLSYAYELDMIEELSQVVFGARYLGTLQTERKLQLDDDVAAVVEEAFAHELSARAELHAPLADETGRYRIGAEVLWSQGEYGLEIGGQSVTDISSAFDEFTYRGIIGADIGPVSFEIGYDNNEIFDLTASLKFPL